MRNLEKVITEYLSKQTDYAIQIVGNWGIGKTYHYRNKLEPTISNTHVHNNNTKKYKPIYISLFGLKSVEDIATKIVLEFYQSKLFKDYFKPNEKKITLKVTQSVLKIGLRGFLNFHKLGKVNEYLTDIKNIGKTVLDSSELLICFDDLERKDSSLKIEDLTGYINSLVDEEIKILIISNEDLLLKKGDEYKNLKEKIIGITVEFNPDIKATIEDILEVRFSSFPFFKNLLTKHVEDLAEISVSTENNFRHIIYAFDCLHSCYSQIKDQLIDVEDETSEKIKEQLPLLIKLILAFAIEFKASNLKASDINKFRRNFFVLDDPSIDAKSTYKEMTDTKKIEFDILIDKYKINRNEYFLIESVYNYVTGFDEFDINKFSSEFRKRYNLETGKVPIHYRTFTELNYFNCFNLTDKQYETKTKEIIEYAEHGLYVETDYLTVMHFAERFDNILGLNLDEVKDRIINGLKTRLANLPSNVSIDSTRFEFNGDENMSNYNKEIYTVGKDEIKNAEDKRTKEKVETYGQLLFDDPKEFKLMLQRDNTFNYYITRFPVLNYLNLQTVFDKIKKADNQTLHSLKFFFKDRYIDKKMFDEEFVAFDQLTDFLADYHTEMSQNGNEKLKSYFLNELKNSLMELRNPKIREL